MTWGFGLHVILNDRMEVGLNRTIKATLTGAVVLWVLSAAAVQKEDEEKEVGSVPAGPNQQPPTNSTPTPKKAIPRRFIPSEEISADSAVSFPVDI